MPKRSESVVSAVALPVFVRRCTFQASQIEAADFHQPFVIFGDGEFEFRRHLFHPRLVRRHHDGGVLERVTELIEENHSARHITLAQPGITIKLRRDGD